MNEKAKEFIEEIISFNKTMDKNKYVYRGQLDDQSYSLSPSLFRKRKLKLSRNTKKQRDDLFVGYIKKYLSTNENADFEFQRKNTPVGIDLFKPFPINQSVDEILSDPNNFYKMKLFCLEQLIIDRIFNETYKHGIPIYQDSSIQDHNSIAWSNLHRFPPFDKGWPYNHHLPLLSLGQHYGFESRLLDWSAVPLVAIYFAVRESLEKAPDQCGDLCVYVADRAGIENTGFVKCDDDGAQVKTNFYIPPGLANPNAAAQESVLSICRYNYGTQRGITFMTDDKSPVGLEGIAAYNGYIHKFSLSREHAADVLKILDIQYGINAKTIFPGHEGFMKYIKESMLY